MALFPSRLTHFFSSMKLCAVRELGFSSLTWLISSTVKFISRASSVATQQLQPNLSPGLFSASAAHRSRWLKARTTFGLSAVRAL